MRRREFISLLGGTAAVWPVLARAQSTRNIPHIGILWHAANAEQEEPYFSAIINGLRDVGYVDGGTVVLEHRFPNEQPDQFRKMAAQLVALQPDVLVGIGANASPFIKQATSSIPIVFVIVPDPVGSELVESLARPGGNATGLSTIAPELTGKRLELIKQTVPELMGVALLVNPDARISQLYTEEAQAAGKSLGLRVEVVQARSLDLLPEAFKAAASAGVKAMMINQEGLFFVGRGQIAQLALEHRLATCVWSSDVLKAGALLSYGPNLVGICRRTGVLVQKIIRGEKPAEIPVEQPTKFQLGVNLKAAKALDITISPSLLATADEVIE
jgi:putative tryptophan/tyrosine transport system substrate-binding protein